MRQKMIGKRKGGEIGEIMKTSCAHWREPNRVHTKIATFDVAMEDGGRPVQCGGGWPGPRLRNSRREGEKRLVKRL
jgi:hypothetical protein